MGHFETREIRSRPNRGPDTTTGSMPTAVVLGPHSPTNRISHSDILYELVHCRCHRPLIQSACWNGPVGLIPPVSVHPRLGLQLGVKLRSLSHPDTSRKAIRHTDLIRQGAHAPRLGALPSPPESFTLRWGLNPKLIKGGG